MEEPTPEYTRKIIDGVIKDYEQFFGLKFEKQAIESAISLSVKYIHNKHLPDKALDILDAAAAKCVLDKGNKITKKDIEKEEPAVPFRGYGRV